MNAPEFDIDFSGEFYLTYSAEVIEVRFCLTQSCFAKVNSHTNPSTLVIVKGELTDLWGI